jgi:hypothetical protein
MHSMFVYFGACPPIYIKLFYRSCINRFELFPVRTTIAAWILNYGTGSIVV